MHVLATCARARRVGVRPHGGEGGQPTCPDVRAPSPHVGMYGPRHASACGAVRRHRVSCVCVVPAHDGDLAPCARQWPAAHAQSNGEALAMPGDKVNVELLSGVCNVLNDAVTNPFFGAL